MMLIKDMMSQNKATIIVLFPLFVVTECIDVGPWNIGLFDRRGITRPSFENSFYWAKSEDNKLNLKCIINNETTNDI